MKIQDVKEFIQEHWQHPEIKYPIITAVVVSGLYMMGASWVFSAVTLGIIYSVPLIRFFHEFSSSTLDILHNVNTTTEHASDVAKEAKKTVKVIRKDTLVKAGNVVTEAEQTVKTVRTEALGEVGKNLDNITYPLALPGRFMKYIGSWFGGTSASSPESASTDDKTKNNPSESELVNKAIKVPAKANGIEKPQTPSLSDDVIISEYCDDDMMVMYNCGTRAASGLQSGISWLWNKARGQTNPTAVTTTITEQSRPPARVVKKTTQFSNRM
jgi:hypothetical protein